MGNEEYFYSGALCFIEWPELSIHEISNKSTSMLHTINDNAQVWRQQEGPPKAVAAFPEVDMADDYDWERRGEESE